MQLPYEHGKKEIKVNPKEWTDIYFEQTLLHPPKPSLEKVKHGIFLCCKCKKRLKLENFSPLTMGRCAKCDAPNFIPQKISDYWLFIPLASGSSSRVYEALRESEPDCDLAVKLLPVDKRNNQDAIDTLMREAQISYVVAQHPNLTEILEYGHADGEHFVVLERIDGVRLDWVLDSAVKRPQEQVILWALQILSAVNHIYKCGYLFRALQPKNILIDLDGNIRLVDYGMAVKIEDTRSVNEEQLEGSILYMPPERILGKAEEQCSEIYTLGMLLYHLLAREPYFPYTDFEDIANKHISPVRLESLALKLPHGTYPELIRIIKRMIRCYPKERYQTFKEVGNDLYKLFNSI